MDHDYDIFFLKLFAYIFSLSKREVFLMFDALLCLFFCLVNFCIFVKDYLMWTMLKAMDNVNLPCPLFDSREDEGKIVLNGFFWFSFLVSTKGGN